MANISGLLGTAGGFKGTGVAGPQNSVTPDQLNTAYSGTQGSMQQQQALLNALAAQNGLQNQSNVYSQLQGVANGTGPNPAQAQLAQATAANTANQAALMAGQRGSNANVGLMARQAAQQGSQNQQQAAGQAASLQAQQSLNALQGMGSMANQQAAQQIGQTNSNAQAQLQNQQNLLNANAGMNQVNAGLIGQVSQQQAAIGGGGMNAIGSMLAEGGKVQEPISMASGGQTPYMNLAPSMAAPQAISPASGPQSFVGQALNNGVTTSGGMDPGPQWGNQALTQAGTSLGKDIKKSQSDSTVQTNTPDPFNSNNSPSVSQLPQAGTPGQSLNVDEYAKGGKVPALVSPGEIRIKRKDVLKVAKGEKSPLDGEKIPGKPKVSGAKNSYANDTVRRTLNEGDIILPRSVTQAKHPHWAAHKFVSDILAKDGKLPKKVK